MRITTTTVYGGSKMCPCGRTITPLEAIYSRDGLCKTCHGKRVRLLISSGMVDDPRTTG